jgi:hypothetical protein
MHLDLPRPRILGELCLSREHAELVMPSSGNTLSGQINATRRPGILGAPDASLDQALARWAAALTLIVLGLVLSIPGIPGPGILVILIGIFVLLPESRWLRKKYAALKRRYPRIFSPIETRRARARHERHAHRRSRRGS